jgi:hypothetical protein
LLFSEPAHAEPSKRVWEFDAKCVSENQKHDAVKQQQKESDDGDTEQTRKKAAKYSARQLLELTRFSKLRRGRLTIIRAERISSIVVSCHSRPWSARVDAASCNYAPSATKCKRSALRAQSSSIAAAAEVDHIAVGCLDDYSRQCSEYDLIAKEL